MFEGFETARIATAGTEIHLRRGGDGPPVLLLHGYPQTHAMWHAVAPALAERFTVVAPDLRGYGRSGKPPGGARHEAYSKRAMAADMVEVMAALGFERFAVVGHDRGARVAHRMALDHRERVAKAALLDIAPTLTMFERCDKAFAIAYYHWFFLSQPEGLPERLIGADPDFFLEWTLGRWSRSGSWLAPAALADYRTCFRDPATIHASCEDYRAAADLDRKLACPLLVLWGAKGVVGRSYDVPAVWRERALDVRGQALDCGHFLAEEAASDTLTALTAFL